MTTVFVHDDDKTQTIHCSDGSQGVMQVSQKNSAPYYAFRFYSYVHPSFWVDQDQFHNGEDIVVKDIQRLYYFQLPFVYRSFLICEIKRGRQSSKSHNFGGRFTVGCTLIT